MKIETIKKIMDSHYTYGIVEGSDITLFNNATVSARIANSDFLENVTVEISEGILYITGDKIEYDLYSGHDRKFKDEWKKTPDPKEIKIGRRWPWSKKEEFVYGAWVRTMERTSVKYIMNNYKIKVLD